MDLILFRFQLENTPINFRTLFKCRLWERNRLQTGGTPFLNWNIWPSSMSWRMSNDRR